MKKIKIYLSFIAVFALLFTSCSKDEQGTTMDSEKATLSFGAIVQDLANKSTEKQSDIGDMPDCTGGDPAYVEILLMQGETEVVGTAMDPYRVDLVEGQVFTEEDEKLELVPGDYTLEHFAVYDADGGLLWLAPKGGALAEFVDNPLPLTINLGAGVKKYVDVSVVCYDDRDVNLYGYQFFELDVYEAAEFCFFANYCTPEGRHFPARYAVDISIDGNVIYENVVNTVGRNDDGDLFAESLCFALPMLEEYEQNEEYIDYTLTLLDWTEHEDAYGDVEQTVITGSLSKAEIMANHVGDNDVEYEHFRFGCGDDGEEPAPVDTDQDGTPDEEDTCPTEAGPASNNGCPEDGNGNGDVDSDEDGVVDEIDTCENTPKGATVDANGCPSDSDSDGILDGIDVCPSVDPEVDENNDGCEDDTTVVGCTGLPGACTIDTEATLDENCYYASLTTDNEGWIEVNSDTELDLFGGLNGDESFGDVNISLSNNTLSVSLDGEFSEDRITAYAIEVRPNENDAMSGTCWESACDTSVAESDQLDEINNVFDDFTYSYPIFIRVDLVNCTNPVGLPD